MSTVLNDGKEQNSNCVDEGREVCIIDQGKYQGYPPWVAQQHES